MKRIYLDHNATSPLLPAVRERVLEEFAQSPGHPDALHRDGFGARNRLREARESIARSLGAAPSEIVFTSGGSESNATALHSMTLLSSPKIPRIVVGATEHPSVLDALDALVHSGRAEAAHLPMMTNGRVDPDSLESALRGATGLALMAANNETGVMTDLATTARIVRASGVHWHCDAVQLHGRAPMTLNEGALSAVGTLSLSGHKLGALPGTGILMVRDDLHFSPLIVGGGQEQGRRGGTANIAGARALSKALEPRIPMTSRLRDRLEEDLMSRFPHSRVHGSTTERLPQTLSIALATGSGEWVDAEEVQLALTERGIAVATGAACTSGSGRPSHVLLAMGCSPEIAGATLRFSWNQDTTEACIDATVSALKALL
jgi:cysteine desulfurase